MFENAARADSKKIMCRSRRYFINSSVVIYMLLKVSISTFPRSRRYFINSAAAAAVAVPVAGCGCGLGCGRGRGRGCSRRLSGRFAYVRVG